MGQAQPFAAAASAPLPASKGRRRPSQWPFKVTTPPDAISEFGVAVPRRQEVEFKDGERIWLSHVLKSGTADLFLRELGQPAQGTVIDLRHYIPDIERELPQTSTRDVAGFVNLSLRLRFATRAEFLEAVVKDGRPA